MTDASWRSTRMWLVAFVGVLAIVVLTGPGGIRFGTSAGPGSPVTPVAQVVNDDAGDARATSTYDGPLVRRRTAIAVHPTQGADRALVRRQVRAAAELEKVGPLTDATFAVFSEQLLTYLVPEVVLVLPEGGTASDAEVVMRDHHFPGVAFYLVESVLVHDLTFAVTPVGVSAAAAVDAVEREGILADSLGHHRIETRTPWLVTRYFGALLSDGQVLAVRQSLARAAGVDVDRVYVEPSSPGPGVDLSGDPAGATESHSHG